jgi:OmpA-OmpF porin, OOP family
MRHTSSIALISSIAVIAGAIAVACGSRQNPAATGGAVSPASAPSNAPSPSDRDGDSVPDAEDACPDVAGSRYHDPTVSGCPRKTVFVENTDYFKLGPVYFGQGSDAIGDAQVATLDRLVDGMKNEPDLLLEIRGYADDSASADEDTKLSERRAEAVKRWLEGRGIQSARLSTKALGRTEPANPEQTAKARAENRRVQFVLRNPSRSP